MITILNVDDNAVSRYARSKVLRQAGYDVQEAETGTSALAMVNELRPALVLLDVNLPDISGFDVCRAIKAHPRAAATPVLHISASAIEEQDLITGLQAADAYVVEPVQPDVLLAFVAALLRGSELLREWVATFDALGDGVALLTADGKVLRCNSAFCRLLGKRVSEVIGHSVMEAVAGIRCDDDESPFPRSLRTGQSESMECAYGEKTYRLNSHPAIVRGRVAGAIYIIADVTQEVRAAREKDEAFALLQALTDAAPVGFAFFDSELRYRLVNKEMARISGKAVEEHIGRTPEEIAPSRAAHIRSMFQQVSETGTPLLDREVVDAAREGRSWSESWYPVRSANGRLLGVGATVIETTEQKRAEQSRLDLEKRMQDAQKLESIGLLAGGIAHDFNNLLTGILGNASLARELAPAGTTIAGCLGDIVKASERAAHLTMQMLAYSGKGQFFVESTNLSQETEDVVRLVQSSIPQKISVSLHLPKELPRIRADKGQLQQVVMNIVVNAAEAIGDTQGTLSIQTGVRDLSENEIRADLNAMIEPGRFVFLEVRDTGCGMDEATKARIFDPFFTTKFTGRGLGLAAVGGIVRAHNGAIRVASSPGQGSCFEVFFPVAEQPASFVPSAPAEEIAPSVPLCGTVLVVDDEQMVLRTARSALQRHGCSVILAESGPAAIDLLRRHAAEVSLIVLDLSMPGMSGLEVLPELRSLRPDVPVLISSGYSEAETLRLFTGHKISGFLQKPYTSRRLLERVKAAVVSE
ncbi:MAG TPA: response regulator [Candidatus Sulfopaludibacter sp.]|jgi:PAS domain S-box-containing protein|nr:response regulator [Candidatus Sulfopaludibacter sp.]